MSGHFSSESYWAGAWLRHLETYLAAAPRCGYWLAAMFPDKKLTFIEIACGSARDSRYLAEKGYSAVAIDFDSQTIEYLKRRFPNSPLQLFREDAFKLSFPDKSFDVSFSNGFWVLFWNDHEICRLLREQARVTRRYCVTLVHNARNARLIKDFTRKADTDSLYGIRFFQVGELRRIVDSSGVKYKTLRFSKFGGPVDLLYSSRIAGVPNPLKRIAPGIVPRLYRLQSWRNTERIACLIELDV